VRIRNNPFQKIPDVLRQKRTCARCGNSHNNVLASTKDSRNKRVREIRRINIINKTSTFTSEASNMVICFDTICGRHNEKNALQIGISKFPPMHLNPNSEIGSIWCNNDNTRPTLDKRRNFSAGNLTRAYNEAAPLTQIQKKRVKTPG
jgi:ribosomal protein S27AE